MADAPQFARASDTTELRGEVSRDLLKALDALALVDGDKSRIAYVVGVLENHVAVELKRLTLLNRMLVGNPLLTDTSRSAAQSEGQSA